MTPLFGTNCGNCKDYIEQYLLKVDAIVDGAVTDFQRLINKEYAGMHNTEKTEEERMDHMKRLCHQAKMHIVAKKQKMIAKLRQQKVALDSLDGGKDDLVKKIEKEILEQEKIWGDRYDKMEATVGDLEGDINDFLSAKDEAFQTMERKLRAENEQLRKHLAQKEQDWTDGNHKLASVTKENEVLRDTLLQLEPASARDKEKIEELEEEARHLRVGLAEALGAEQKANRNISEMGLELVEWEKISAEKDLVIEKMKKTAEKNEKEIQELKKGKIQMKEESHRLKGELATANTALLTLQEAELEKNLRISEVESKLEKAEKITADNNKVIEEMKKTAEGNTKEIQELEEEKIQMQKKSGEDKLVMNKLKDLLKKAEDNEKERQAAEELEKVKRQERFERKKVEADRKMKRKLEEHEKEWGPIKSMKTDDEEEICDPSDSGCSTP